MTEIGKGRGRWASPEGAPGPLSTVPSGARGCRRQHPRARLEGHKPTHRKAAVWDERAALPAPSRRLTPGFVRTCASLLPEPSSSPPVFRASQGSSPATPPPSALPWAAAPPAAAASQPPRPSPRSCPTRRPPCPGARSPGCCRR